ncbi:sulfotransferase 6B1-like isoform X1 [Aquarana catesbeiana]|uniref:sulfotransferase 6B1-like isoform X1 n=1 Tax=Aquarana catesbeiana TaxID=8400 RepID=UPI003CCA3639
MADMTQFLQEVTKAFETSKNIPKDELIFTYDGVLYPTATCDMDTFKALETFETREDDVMLAAYPKCVVWGSYFDHAVVWNKHLDTDTVLLMTFEDMKEILSTPEATREGSKRRANSGSPTPQKDTPEQPASSSAHKRSRFASPTSDTEPIN